MQPEYISCNMPYREVFGLLHSILVSSRKNGSYWAFRLVDPTSGEIIASLCWRELFGDILGEMPRFVEVILKVEPISGFEDKSCITLAFDIISPLHRGQVNDVIETTRRDIKMAVGAA